MQRNAPALLHLYGSKGEQSQQEAAQDGGDEQLLVKNRNSRKKRMSDPKEQWRLIRQTVAGITERFPYITDLGSEQTTRQVDRLNAARAIVEGTHRLATPEEIRSLQDEHTAYRRRITEGEKGHRARPSRAYPVVLAGRENRALSRPKRRERQR